MLNRRPGAYIFMGNGDTAGVHHPSYDFNDEAPPSESRSGRRSSRTACRPVSGCVPGTGTHDARHRTQKWTPFWDSIRCSPLASSASFYAENRLPLFRTMLLGRAPAVRCERRHRNGRVEPIDEIGDDPAGDRPGRKPDMPVAEGEDQVGVPRRTADDRQPVRRRRARSAPGLRLDGFAEGGSCGRPAETRVRAGAGSAGPRVLRFRRPSTAARYHRPRERAHRRRRYRGPRARSSVPPEMADGSPAPPRGGNGSREGGRARRSRRQPPGRPAETESVPPGQWRVTFRRPARCRCRLRRSAGRLRGEGGGEITGDEFARPIHRTGFGKEQGARERRVSAGSKRRSPPGSRDTTSTRWWARISRSSCLPRSLPRCGRA